MNTAIKQIVLKSKKFVTKNSPIILTVTAAVGVVTAVVLTAKAAPKTKEIIDDCKEEFEKIDSDESLSEEEKKEQKNELIFDTSKMVAPLVLPPVIVTGMTIGSIILSHRINLRRQIALATACDISNKALEEYQAKAKEVLGGNKEKEKIRDAIAQDYADHPATTEIITTGDGNQLFRDPKSGREFRSSSEYIRKCWAKVNQHQVGGFVKLNYFYDLIGIPDTDFGSLYGWNESLDNWAELEFDCCMRGDEPMIILDYRVELSNDDYILRHMKDPI